MGKTFLVPPTAPAPPTWRVGSRAERLGGWRVYRPAILTEAGREHEEPAPAHVEELLGGEALLPPWCEGRSGACCPWAWPLRLLVLRTYLRIQARRLARQLCSDSTMRGHGLPSTMSSAEMATARPT
ncbi:hypothetical protein CRUP_016012 [Coryphaenoides rupestris]|nr:hypothetical protein CRUP_016012 [Coryphaenoides rupestris]